MALAECIAPENVTSHTGYSRYGCRCDGCMTAKHEHDRSYRERNKDRLTKETKEKRNRRKRITDAIKLAIGCLECGYNEHPSALHFDHLEPSTKVAHISDSKMLAGNIMTLLDEVEKCQVLCANCHAVKTWGDDLSL